MRAARSKLSWRRLGGHFLVAGAVFDGLLSPFFRLVDLFLRLRDHFLPFELFAPQILSLGGASFGGLFELLRFEPNFAVALFFS